MKQYYALLLILLCPFFLAAQTTEYADDFENGLSNWTTTGSWGTASAYAYNGTYSLADSPSGLYQNATTSYATLDSVMDLSSALDASVHMRLKFDIENGFDYCYLEMSSNNGSSWTTMYTFNGENNLNTWTNFSVSAGGLVGNSQVKLRFRWYSDAGYTAYGIYMDSLRIISDTTDNAPPLIVHDPDPHFEGEPDTNYREVTITDISGVAQAELTYTVDNGPQNVITPIDTNGDVYTFAIPPQDAGAYVDYFIDAVDSSAQQNAANSQIYQYISGNYIKHDNGTVSFVQSFSAGGFTSGVANRITLSGQTTLTTALIRNYTDVNNPNDSIQIHVWSNNSGTPGTDLITPFNVFPEANLLEPQRMTRIDLRDYESQLDSLQGNIFIGFTVPSGQAWVCETSGSNGRGYTYNGSTWSSSSYTYHFRAITTDPLTPPDAYFTADTTNDPEVAFTDLSNGNPTSWYWDFDDGDTSSAQHPTHTYENPGTYNVCLTATNFVGSSQAYCENVTVVNAAPLALFLVDQSNDPSIQLDEFSLYNPTSWSWDLGDGNSSTLQEPEHTYGSAGSYDICLIASNAYGSDTACQNVNIVNYLPIPLFQYEVQVNNIVTFENLTAIGNPTATDYHWDFENNGDTSIVAEPTYNFPLTGGTFEVCLIASNTVGSSNPYCSDVELNDLTVGVHEVSANGFVVAPNPAVDFVQIKSSDGSKHIQSYRFVSVDGSINDLKATRLTNGLEFNVSSLAQGIYFLELTSDDDSITRLPIVIQ
ncbi:MAG: PKD domain-containing protein [Flavobacteriales bacterium]|nr:PKD domain-containing protein [Flavobacteriales bacterium]